MNPQAASFVQALAAPATAAAAHAAARPVLRGTSAAAAPKPKPRAEDQFLSSTTEVDSAEAMRSLKGNDQEETHDDRSKRQSQGGRASDEPDPPRHVDVSA